MSDSDSVKSLDPRQMGFFLSEIKFQFEKLAKMYRPICFFDPLTEQISLP